MYYLMADSNYDRFVAPDTVTLDELKAVRRVFPKGVNVEIHQEA